MKYNINTIDWNTINWNTIDQVVAAAGGPGFSGGHWDKEAGTFTVQTVIATPRASIRPKVVRVIQDLLNEALDAMAEYVSINTIAKATCDYAVVDDRGLMVFVATAPDEVMKVEHEALFSGGLKAMLPVGMIVWNYASEAGKQAVKLMGRAAFLAKADET
jgi:hypothetical protein